jgi:hypothetical protein
VQRTIDKPHAGPAQDVFARSETIPVRAVKLGHPFGELPFDGTRRISRFLLGSAEEDPDASPQSGTCLECERLLAHSRKLRNAHVDAGSLLSAKHDMVSPAGYIALRIAADETRIDSAIARLEFERHWRCHCKAVGNGRGRGKPVKPC